MHGNDVGPGPQIGVTDESIELSAGLGQARLDLIQPLLLLFGVVVSTGSSQAYSLRYLVSLSGDLRSAGASGGASSGPPNASRPRRMSVHPLCLNAQAHYHSSGIAAVCLWPRTYFRRWHASTL